MKLRKAGYWSGRDPEKTVDYVVNGGKHAIVGRVFQSHRSKLGINRNWIGQAVDLESWRQLNYRWAALGTEAGGCWRAPRRPTVERSVYDPES
jgi:hypothetical protein